MILVHAEITVKTCAIQYLMAIERVVMTLVISGSDVEVFGTSVVNEVSSDTG